MSKKFRLLYRLDGRATYLAVTSEGSEMLTLAPDGSRSSNFIGGVCLDCAFGASPCRWPECPRRNNLTPVRDLVADVAELPVTDSPAPVPTDPVVDAELVADDPDAPAKRSRFDRITSWGPGPGALW
jgi:hypothetical protein